VKGRDWYDIEWYVRNGHPADLHHLRMRTIQGDNSKAESFTTEHVKELLKEKIRSTPLKRVLDDVKPFVKDPSELDHWSTEYFLQLVDLIKFRG